MTTRQNGSGFTTQKKPMEAITAQFDRVGKERYVGREGLQPVLVRVDRCERIVNALACAACPGSVSISLSDLIGTQVQSADAGRDESVNQTATPTNTSGVTGDKPIETIGEVGKTALTGGTSTVLKQAASAVGLTDTATNAEKVASAASGSACADGACAVPAAK